MGIRVKTPMPVHEDNQTCISMAKHPSAQKRTRYVDIRYHFIRDHVNLRHITMSYCETRHMLADILTKSMPRADFTRIRNQILRNVDQYLGHADLPTKAIAALALLHNAQL